MPYRLIRTADSFRGTFLFLAGLMFIPAALSYMLDDRMLSERNPAFDWAPSFMMVWHVGLLCLVQATTAMVIGLFSKRINAIRGKSGRLGAEIVGWGYFSAMASPLLGAILGILSLIYGGPISQGPAVFFYLILATTIYLGSEWPNPVPLVVLPDRPPLIQGDEE